MITYKILTNLKPLLENLTNARETVYFNQKINALHIWYNVSNYVKQFSTLHARVVFLFAQCTCQQYRVKMPEQYHKNSKSLWQYLYFNYFQKKKKKILHSSGPQFTIFIMNHNYTEFHKKYQCSILLYL